MSEADIYRRVLKLRLFGTLQACLGNEPLPPLRSRKGDWLLAILAMRGGAVSRSWLAGTLWPESDESRALLYLRRELTFLRKALGPECDRLLSVGRNLQLKLDAVECDLVAFDAAILRGDETSLERAVSLYGGPLLEGCDVEWVRPERQSRERAHGDALERLADLAAARGDTAAATSRLRTVVALNPLRESAYRALMKALADRGDSAAAVQVYRDLRLYLRREMNADADPETTALFQQIRNTPRRRTEPAARTPGTGHAARLLRIPLPLTPLIGRHRELWEARRRIGSTRLLVLTGTGGVGKTRLAIEIAEEMKDDFIDGVCFVELAALGDAAFVPQAVMDALGLKPESRQTGMETLSERLRSANLLLVLDNCEHLIQACAELAGSLLSACAQLRILATSREPLGIAGESLWRVPPLSFPPAMDPSGPASWVHDAEVVEYEAILLFVERARQARSDFALTVHNAQSVARVCRRLDGIPLAIELAAVRIRSLTVEDLDSKLDGRFRLLTGGSRTALPRHQTLRSLIDWSYDLLNEPERALLCRLSVFAGGWTLAAAEQVCAGEAVDRQDILDLLTSLCDKSLVASETVGSSVRYRLLETLRAYARERLDEAGDAETWRSHHLLYVLALAEQAEPHLSGSEQQAWLERIDSEYDNVRAALAWSEATPDKDEAGLRLCGALWRFWLVRGYLGEGRRWCAASLDLASRAAPAASRLAPPSEPSAARGKALTGAGIFANLQGEYETARLLGEEALGIWQRLGNRVGIAGMLNSLGNIAREQGDYATARALYDEALAIRQELGDRDGIAGLKNNLGLIAITQGDYPAARSLYEEALSIWRERENDWGVAVLLDNLGNVALVQGDLVAARALVEEALGIRRALGHRRGIAVSLNSLGNVLRANGEDSAAFPLLIEALAIRRELGDRAGIAASFEDLASSTGGRQPTWAARLWSAAARLREELGSPLLPAERANYEAQITGVRAAMGEDRAFERAWQAGRTMTLEQAVAFALAGPLLRTATAHEQGASDDEGGSEQRTEEGHEGEESRQQRETDQTRIRP